MNAGALFDLAELLIESGSAGDAIKALVQLEPTVLPALQGGATPQADLDQFAALPAATEQQEIAAAQVLLGALGRLIESPQYKARTVACLKSLFAKS